MVLAPEHPLVDRITTDAQREAVDAYREQAASPGPGHAQEDGQDQDGRVHGWVRRQSRDQARTIPVWIADYVLMEYGTGAIMAVPGHDERDFEFATQFDLPIVRVVAPAGEDAAAPLAEAYTGPGVLVNTGEFDGLGVRRGQVARHRSGWRGRGWARRAINYRLHDWTIIAAALLGSAHPHPVLRRVRRGPRARGPAARAAARWSRTSSRTRRAISPAGAARGVVRHGLPVVRRAARAAKRT